MSNSKEKGIVVGLDIGTTKIVCMVGSKNEYGKIEILGMGKSESVGVTRGVVSNIDKTVGSIKTAVAEAEAQSGVNIRVVNVGIAGQHIKSLQHRGEKIRHTVEDEIAQVDIDSLIVSEAYVGKNLVMKRFRARARGRGAKILKPFSELTIIVREVEEVSAENNSEAA